MSKPRFEREQTVQFIGGSGIIKGYQVQAGSWSYLIEMEQGPMPTMGRVGDETKIVLMEMDLQLA